jgi:hypothetical protein
MSVAVTPDGQRIVTGGWDGTARLWDAVGGRPLLKINGNHGPIWSIAMSPQGQQLVTRSADGTTTLWDVTEAREILTLQEHGGTVGSVAVTPDGQRLITGSEDGTTKLWDITSGRELLPLRERSNGAAAGHCVAVTPDSRRLITGRSDGTATVWDTATGQELLSLKGHTDAIRSLAVTPDGRRILTGGADRTAKLWDAVSGRELLTLKGHTGAVLSVAVTPDGRHLITGSDDGTVKIWEAAAPEKVAFWMRREQEVARRLAAWQRPFGSAPGFIRNWLVLGPLALKDEQTGGKGLEREQLLGEAKLQPREGEHVPVDGQEYTWKAYTEEEPVLDFNRFVGKQWDNCVAYAACYVISPVERNDLLLQVGSDDEAKVYLNGQEVYKYTRNRPLVTLDPVGPLRLRKGTNVLMLKVVNETLAWLGCARFVDRDGNPVQGLEVRLTPE